MLNGVSGKKVARRYWWQLIFRGSVAILFGLLTFFWPITTLVVLILFFGAWMLVDGLFAVAAGIEERRVYARWWILLIEGIVGIVMGILTFAFLGIAILILFTFIALWAILTGILEIVTALSLSRTIRGEWLLALAGVLSILFGIILFIEPRAFALAIVYLLAAYAVIFGIVLFARAVAVRSLFSMVS